MVNKSLFVFLTCLIFSIQFHGQNRYKNQEWLKLDKKILGELLINLQYFRNDNPDVFTKRFEKLNVLKTQDLGFGAKLYVCALYGGYTTQWLDLLCYNNKIANINCHVSKEDTILIAELISSDSKLNDLNKKYKMGRTVITGINLIDSFVYKGFMFTLASNLGPVDHNLDILQDSIRKSYEYLSNPTIDLTYGQYCGYSNTELTGFKCIKILINNKKINLIDNILRSGNATGRLFAIFALYTLENDFKIPISKDDLKDIEILINLPINIPACEGCDGYSTNAKDEFGKQFEGRY